MDRERPSITAATGLVALLGHPVRHSRSPQIHNAAFQAQGEDLVYLAFDVPPDHLREAVAGLRALDFVGANLTIPHKEAVVPLVDRLDSQAQQIGAVNTLVNEGGVIVGHNTDAAGFLAALEREWGRGPAGARCLLLGAGGAARAVAVALLGAGIEELLIHNRTRQRAEALCGSLGTGAGCRTIDAAELKAAAARCDLVVNATSVGLGHGVKESPLSVDMVEGRHVVVDLVYGPEATALVRAARQRGALAIDGREMLVQQAARSYQLWTGRTAPVDLMRDELGRT